MMNVKAIDELIDAKFAFEQARESLYYGSDKPVDKVYEALNLDRFEKVRKTLGRSQVRPVKIGNIVNRSFEYRGCVFLCTQMGDAE